MASITALKRDGIDRAAARSHVPALRLVYNDLLGDMEDLDSGDRAELTHRIEVSFGTNLSDEKQQDNARVLAILRRGRIVDLDEYATLRGFLDQRSPQADSSIVDRATRLVAEFERGL
jgi:hypothetical protein